VASKLYQESQDPATTFNESINDWRMIQVLVKRQTLKIVDDDLRDVSEGFEKRMRESTTHRPMALDVGKTLLSTAIKAKTASKENLSSTYTKPTQNSSVVIVTNDANIRAKATSASIFALAYDNIRARLLGSSTGNFTSAPDKG
jgi:predicted ribonuclease YlaK